MEEEKKNLEDYIRDENDIIKISLVEFVFYIFNIAFIIIACFFLRSIVLAGQDIFVVTLYRYYLRILIFQILGIILSLFILSFAYGENLNRINIVSKVFYIVNTVFLILVVYYSNNVSISLQYFDQYILTIRVLEVITVLLLFGILPIRNMIKKVKKIENKSLDTEKI